MLLEKLVAAGIGNQPVVFVTHRLVWLLESIHISCLHRRLAMHLLVYFFIFMIGMHLLKWKLTIFILDIEAKQYIEFNSKRLTNSCLKIKLGGHTILQITLFKYLGSII